MDVTLDDILMGLYAGHLTAITGAAWFDANRLPELAAWLRGLPRTNGRLLLCLLVGEFVGRFRGPDFDFWSLYMSSMRELTGERSNDALRTVVPRSAVGSRDVLGHQPRTSIHPRRRPDSHHLTVRDVRCGCESEVTFRRYEFNRLVIGTPPGRELRLVTERWYGRCESCGTRHIDATPGVDGVALEYGTEQREGETSPGGATGRPPDVQHRKLSPEDVAGRSTRG